MTTDQDLDVALALFNDGLERQKADRRAAKAIENAEKTKQQAAAALKRLQNDSGASAEDRAAAEAAYRDAVTAFNALRNGEAPPAGDETDDDAETTGDDEEVVEAGEATAESDTAAAGSADDSAEAVAETAEAAPPADATTEDETAG
ncbi:MAG: hypothetical protein ACE367_22715 [Acidimicrobiales bacterium]